MSTHKLIIGCPVKNDVESLKEMIKSLLNSTFSYDEIVFVLGKNITNEANEFCYNLQRRYNKIKIINAETTTSLHAYNILFKLAKDLKSDLILTQTDVIFPKLYRRDWIQSIKALSILSDCGAVIPLNGGGISGPDYVDGLHWIGGWCTYLPYRTLEKISGFDENFPNGFGVDIDLTYQILNLGLKIYQTNYWVDHHMMNERAHDNNPESEKMKKESAEYFRKKWKIGEYK